MIHMQNSQNGTEPQLNTGIHKKDEYISYHCHGAFSWIAPRATDCPSVNDATCKNMGKYMVSTQQNSQDNDTQITVEQLVNSLTL